MKTLLWVCAMFLCSYVFATNLAESAPTKTVGADAEDRQYRLLMPNLGLEKNSDWIEAVHLTVSCGHIQAITAIPIDWSVDVVSKMSEVENMRATAAHGATRLSSIAPFNGTIRITGVTHDCFDISAKIFVSGERDRVIDLSRADLKLKR